MPGVHAGCVSVVAEVMNVISYFLALIAAALCAGCGTSPYQGSSSGASTEVTHQDCFAAALQEHMPGVLASNHVPGAVVSYIKNAEVAWTKAFGVCRSSERNADAAGHGVQSWLEWQDHDGVGPDASGRSREGRVGRTFESLFETMVDSFDEVRSQWRHAPPSAQPYRWSNGSRLRRLRAGRQAPQPGRSVGRQESE